MVRLNYYQVLGVEKSSTSEEIKKARFMKRQLETLHFSKKKKNQMEIALAKLEKNLENLKSKTKKPKSKR